MSRRALGPGTWAQQLESTGRVSIEPKTRLEFAAVICFALGCAVLVGVPSVPLHIRVEGAFGVAAFGMVAWYERSPSRQRRVSTVVVDDSGVAVCCIQIPWAAIVAVLKVRARHVTSCRVQVAPGFLAGHQPTGLAGSWMFSAFIPADQVPLAFTGRTARAVATFLQGEVDRRRVP